MSLAFDDVEFPRVARQATASEEVVFETIAPLDELPEHVFTEDELRAKLTLVNGETGEQWCARAE